jgi:ClpP class serine protease
MLRALSSELWAIEPGWLPMLAAIAQRNTSSPDVEAAREWVKRDHAILAGAGAQKLAGAYRTHVVNGIAIVPITGPIFPRANMLTEMSGATSLTIVRNDYRVALASKEVRAVMLMIDSPGGAVSGIADFALSVARGSALKETHAFVTGMAASAAYWIASSARRISIDRTAMLGSIGVVAAVEKQVQAGEDGYISIEVVSSNAPNKRPDPQSDDGLNVIRGQLDALEQIFIADVARGRRIPGAKVIQDFGRGGILIGAAAVAVGMADKVEDQGAAMNALALAARWPGSASASTPANSADQRRANLMRLAQLRHRR